MKDLDQPWDLNQTWPVGGKWCRFTNVPKNFGAALPKFGAQKRQILDHFLPLAHLTPHCGISPERNVASTNKNTSVNLQCPLNVDLLSVTFDPETA